MALYFVWPKFTRSTFYCSDAKQTLVQINKEILYSKAEQSPQGFSKRYLNLLREHQPLFILFKGYGISLAYSKVDEIQMVFARIIASWAIVVAWVSWEDEGVAEACYRSISAQQHLYGCSQIQYIP